MPSSAVLAALVSPTARLSHLGATSATVVLAALPAVITVARGGTDVGFALVLLALGAGASLAWAADDPAENLLASMPVGSTVRSSVRAVLAAVVAAFVGAAALAVVAVGPGLPPELADRVPEYAAAAAVALAAGFWAASRGERAAGAGGVLAGLLVPAVVAFLSVRWPRHFPAFEAGMTHPRWWLLAVVAAAFLARTAHDPARR